MLKGVGGEKRNDVDKTNIFTGMTQVRKQHPMYIM